MRRVSRIVVNCVKEAPPQTLGAEPMMDSGLLQPAFGLEREGEAETPKSSIGDVAAFRFYFVSARVSLDRDSSLLYPFPLD
jgi:hypothetical protein